MQPSKILFPKILILFLLIPPKEVIAHPGIGIVKDSKGNIYYTDLKNIWKHSTDGTTAVVVPDVHSHELYMDGDDNLYGEHLWYEGEATDKWGHYVWRLQSDGNLWVLEYGAISGAGIQKVEMQVADPLAVWFGNNLLTIGILAASILLAVFIVRSTKRRKI